MEPTEPTRRKLEAMTIAFAPDNNRRNVEWSEDLRFFGVAKDEDNIAITPYHAEMMDLDIPRNTEFNLLVNTTSHEVEHTVVDTAIIEEFVEQYDEAEQQTASVVMNTLEDVFIDRRRTKRKRGLRPIQAQFAELYVESKEPVHEQDRTQMFVSTFRQVALAGYAKGLKDADDDVQEFAARVRPLIQEVRKTHSTEGRKEIGHQVMEILDEYVDPAEVDDAEYMTAPIGISVEEAEGDEDEDADAQGGQAGEEQDEDEEGDSSGSGGDEDDEGDEDDAAGGDEEGDDQGDEQGGEGRDGDSHGEMEDEVSGKTIDVDAELEDMESGDAGDWHDVPDGQDYTEVPDWIEDKMNTIRSKERERQTEIGKRKAERDERIEEDSYGVNASDIESEYDGQFAYAVREAFRQIKTRDRPTPTERGPRIRVRGVVRRRAGDKTERELFSEESPSEAGDRCITVAVDGSGSMNEHDAKLALRALAHATELIGDRFAAVEFHQSGGVQTNIITAPDETFKMKHLDSFSTGGQTPTAHGIKDARAIADAAPNSEDVLMVITDGAANVDLNSSGRSRDAMEDASAQVNAARAEGKRVIGVGVGGGVTPDYMKAIFGENYVMVDMDNLADKLLEIYRSQMDTV